MQTSKDYILKLKQECPIQYIKKLRKNTVIFEEIIEYNKILQLKYNNISQAVYNFVYDIKVLPVCVECSKPVSFGGNYKWEYSKFCSIQCMAKNKTLIKERGLTSQKLNRSFKTQNKDKLEQIQNDETIKFYDKSALKAIIQEYLKNNQAQNLYVWSLSNDIRFIKSVYFYYPQIRSQPFLETIWNILYEPKVCPICQKPTSFINFSKGYKKFCSEKCRIKSYYDGRAIRVHQLFNTYQIPENQKLFKEQLHTFLLTKDSHNFFDILLKDHSDWIPQIISLTDYLPKDCKFNERIYQIWYDLRTLSVCPQCDKPYTFFSFERGYLGCGNCINGVSTNEIEIRQFLKDLLPNETIRYNDRTLIKPLELDFYIPNKQIAIEFNGLYWHSELAGKNRNYHLVKTQKCLEQNTKLLQIFSSEWSAKSNILKSIISSKLGVFQKRIYARNCSIQEITPSEKQKFLDENHLQGNDNSAFYIGLFNDNELVSLMTFGKRKITKASAKLELIRFCTKLYTQVIGGASKLLTYFERKYQPESLTTYSDRRYGTEGFYKQLGFELSHISKPNYWYFSTKTNNLLENRIKYQKYKLQKRFANFKAELSEWEIMKLNGYNRIWDCGNLVFVKNYEKKETPKLNN